MEFSQKIVITTQFPIILQMENRLEKHDVIKSFTDVFYQQSVKLFVPDQTGHKKPFTSFVTSTFFYLLSLILIQNFSNSLKYLPCFIRLANKAFCSSINRIFCGAVNRVAAGDNHLSLGIHFYKFLKKGYPKTHLRGYTPFDIFDRRDSFIKAPREGYSVATFRKLVGFLKQYISILQKER